MDHLDYPERHFIFFYRNVRNTIHCHLSLLPVHVCINEITVKIAFSTTNMAGCLITNWVRVGASCISNVVNDCDSHMTMGTEQASKAEGAALANDTSKVFCSNGLGYAFDRAV